MFRLWLWNAVLWIRIQWIRIRIQHFKWIRIRIQGFEEKKYNWNFVFFFWSKIAIYLSLGLHKGRPSYRRSLQPSKENIQHIKRWNLLFNNCFLFLCAIFALLDPDPDPGTPLNPDPIRILNIGGMNVYLEIVRSILRHEGMGGFYRGYVTTLLR
jgi:hypothetical protein